MKQHSMAAVRGSSVHDTQNYDKCLLWVSTDLSYIVRQMPQYSGNVNMTYQKLIQTSTKVSIST